MAGVVGSLAAKLLATIGTLIPKIGPLMSSGWASSSSTPTDPVEALNQLKERLLRIQAMLRDAEEMEIQGAVVKHWLKEIKELAYDAEDVLDEYEYELLRYQIEGREAPESEAPSSSSSPSRKRKREEMGEQVCSLFPTCFLGSPMIAKKLVDRVNKINESFDKIAEDRKNLWLRKEDGPRRKDDCMIPQPTGPFVDVLDIYGREADTEKIVNMLLSGDEQFTVLPIVGMGGLGKTTLAQLVYQNERINPFFNLKGWVCVSFDFDLVRLNRAIIESFTGQRCDLVELSALQDTVNRKLQGKKVLLVLDDIWNDKQRLWDSLKDSFLQAAGKIKILVTTRHESVAKIMHTMPPYHLGLLSEESSWLLFQKCAFADQDLMKLPSLIDIGKQIVKKCKKLPLALKVIGGLLRHKEDEESWKDILQSNLWELDNIQEEILPILRLSYFYMPTYLKPCFLYCCLYPKDRYWKIDQLSRLWVAQGYINKPSGAKSAEDTGREYVEELRRKSLLLRSESSGGFWIHDLVHDLASFIYGDECHQIILESGAETQNIPEKCRHLYISSQQSPVSRQISSCIPLRTLVYHCCDLHAILNESFPLEDLGCLRALVLSFCSVGGLPDSIGNLKLLRYLRLRPWLEVMKMERLPESIGRLYNLQVLDFGWKHKGCLRQLPSGTRNLVNLRFLSGVGGRTCMPRGIGKLTNLETLEYFNVGRGAWHCGIEELKGLVNLRGRLNIRGLRNVACVEEARETNLQSKQQIETLVLDWGGGVCEWQHGDEVEEASGFGEEESRDAELEVAVLDTLLPYTTLKTLIIRNYYGTKFPSWMENPSFSRLSTMRLSGIQSCECLPALGQLPFLKYLHILRMNGLRFVGREFRGNPPVELASFPSLEQLCFEDMPTWEKWDGVSDGDFRRLRVLKICRCPKLSSLCLPHTTTASVVFKIEDCPSLHGHNDRNAALRA